MLENECGEGHWALMHEHRLGMYRISHQMADKAPSQMIFRSNCWFSKEGRATTIVTLEISHAFYYLFIDASLVLLLCTLLVVEQIRRETRPRGMLSCVSFMESGSENSADQFVKKIACGKPTIFKVVGDIGQTRQLRNPSNPNRSINISLASVQEFLILQKCGRASHSRRFSPMFCANTIQHQFQLVRTQDAGLQFQIRWLTAPVTALLPLPLGWTTAMAPPAHHTVY